MTSIVAGLSPGTWCVSSEINVVCIHIRKVVREKDYGRTTFSSKLDIESQSLPVAELERTVIFIKAVCVDCSSGSYCVATHSAVVNL